jgi:WD40 repeat protein
MTKLLTFLTTSFLVLIFACEILYSGEETLLDFYGDPLPQGATARFGSLRWRIPKAVNAVALSPNGKLVGAVNMDGKVFVWDKEDGRLLHQFSGSKAGAASLAFSPDGKYLATGGAPDYKTRDGDFHIRIWDLKTGNLKKLFPPVNGSPITKLVFTSDSSTLISAGFGQQVIAWKSPSGEKIREYPTDEVSYHSVALSPDEKWLAASGNDSKTVVVFSLDGSRKLCQLKSNRSYFYNFEFTPDSKALMTHEHDRLRFWDITSGKPRSTIPFEQAASYEFYLAPDGKKIAHTGKGRDNGIHWLDAVTGKPLDIWKESTDRIGALTFSHDGKVVVTGDWGAVRVWNTATGKVIRQPSGPSHISYSLGFSADGKTLLAASQSALFFLDGPTLREQVRIPIAVDGDIFSGHRFPVVLSPDGTLVAFQESKGAIHLVDPREPKAVRTLRCPGWVSGSLAFSADGKTLYVTGYKSAGLRVWNVQTGKEIAPLDKNILAGSNIALAGRAEKLAVAVDGASPRCRLWDLRTGKEEPGFELKNDRVGCGADAILLSEDGKLLLASFANEYIGVWDVAKKAERHRFKFTFEDGPFRWAFSNDSKLLVTSHGDGTIRTWDMANGQKVAEVSGHPTNHIVSIACSPDGAGLVTTCTSCTILRWRKTAWQGK